MLLPFLFRKPQTLRTEKELQIAAVPGPSLGVLALALVVVLVGHVLGCGRVCKCGSARIEPGGSHIVIASSMAQHSTAQHSTAQHSTAISTQPRTHAPTHEHHTQLLTRGAMLVFEQYV